MTTLKSRRSKRQCCIGNVHFLFPPDGSEPRGGIVYVIACDDPPGGGGWAVRHLNEAGGTRTLWRTIWTQKALDFAASQAKRFGARALFFEPIYK